MMICSLSADIVAITNFLIFICLMKIIQCPDIFTFFIIYIEIYSIFPSFLILFCKCVTPRPDEVHSTCNCKGAYVHQVPL